MMHPNIPDANVPPITARKCVLNIIPLFTICLLYTSDAADEEDSVDLGGPRILNKKKKKKEE